MKKIIILVFLIVITICCILGYVDYFKSNPLDFNIGITENPIKKDPVKDSNTLTCTVYFDDGSIKEQTVIKFDDNDSIKKMSGIEIQDTTNLSDEDIKEIGDKLKYQCENYKDLYNTCKYEFKNNKMTYTVELSKKGIESLNNQYKGKTKQDYREEYEKLGATCK